jgi:DNA polymerase bacteriophage-type
MDFKLRYRFNTCDLNAIETRVGAWLAQCTDLMKVFEPWTDAKGHYKPNGKCPYLSFDGKMRGLPFESIYADYEGWNGKERKGAAKRFRQIAKPGVLGAIYRLSGGMLLYMYKCPNKSCWHHKNMWSSTETISYCPKCENDDEIAPQFSKKTGLWDYADKMGVEMSQEQAHQVVEIFRNSYPEICNVDKNKGPLGIWKQLEIAVAEVMDPQRPATVRYIGPNNCVKIDKVNITGRHSMMRMQLPSGRYLHYIDAHLKSTLMPWKGTDEDGEECEVYRDALVYAGTNQKTKQWEVNITSHGGKLFENLVQGIARDILAAKLLRFEAAGMPVVGHVHDEGITLVVDDILSPTVHDMVAIMSEQEKWAKGLLLGADGYQDPYYHK